MLQNANRQWQQCTDSDLKRSWQCAQEQALTAIAALAEKAGDLFVNHYDTFAPILMGIVKGAEGDEMREIRCRAIECMACFGEAVGGDKFGPISASLMKGTISFFDNVQMDEIADDQFVKTNICCWPRVVASIGAQAFGPYLERVCGILEAVASINVISNKIDAKDLENGMDGDDIGINEEEDGVDLVETANGIVAIDSQKLENKMAALAVFDSLCEHYGAAMVQFVERMIGVLVQCVECRYSLDLRSDSCKMAPRYIEVMLSGVNENKATRQQLEAVTMKLVTTMISILDEGRPKCPEINGANDSNPAVDPFFGDGAESAVIGTAAKTVLEMICLVEKTDDENYSASQSVIRKFIGVERLGQLIECMFECVVRSQQRIELFAQRDDDQNYDAIAREEFEEEKEFEDDLLFNIAMILAEFIKIYKDDFVRCLMGTESMRNKLLEFLNPQSRSIRNPQFVHKTGVYIVCDLYEQCSLQNLVSMLSVFVPLLFNIVEHDQDPAVQQVWKCKWVKTIACCRSKTCFHLIIFYCTPKPCFLRNKSSLFRLSLETCLAE